MASFTIAATANNKSIGYANTTGGDGGTYYGVDNVAELLAAVAASGKRYIRFTTGGIYDLESTLAISNGQVTLDGRYADSAVILRAASGFTDTSLITINTNDVILKHLNVMPGITGYAKPDEHSLDCILVSGVNGGEAQNVWVDHCFLAYGNDSLFEVWGGADGAHDVTISNSLLAYPLHDSTHPDGPHGLASIIGNGAYNVSIINCIFAHCAGRLPLIRAWNVEMINCIVYNQDNDTTELDLSGETDPSGNYAVNIIGCYNLGNGLDTNQGPTNQPRFAVNILDANFTVYLSGNRCDKRTDDTFAESDAATGETGSVTGTPNTLSGYSVQRVAEPSLLHLVSQCGANLPARLTVAQNALTDVLNAYNGSPSGNIVDTETEAGGWN